MVRLFPDPFPPACATAWGDDRYGLWCEITVKGIVQRLRWIEPGVFWMGSTDDERKHFGIGDDSWKKAIKNEAPCHRVRLTQGFWLADTTCTQALWQQVTGNNPSHFKGEPDLPVESVNWDDVTMQFLQRLNRQLTEAEVFLPTEAQWEYACRAGADTAFHFGDEITKTQVNANGAGMVEVKKLPPNRWGLYQMHGNVWEWCADARRPYAGAAVTVTDPDGGRQGYIDRAVRGGAWLYEAKKARCASRNGYSHDFPSTDIGFRFALRSVEPDSPSR